MHCERGDQLWLAPGLQPKMKWPAGIDNLFDHLAELIDFDRKNAAVFALVTELSNRVLEGAVDCLDAVSEQILKADQERKTEAALARFVYDFEDVDRPAVFLEGLGNDVARAVDCEVTAAPALDVVSGNRGFNVPLGFHRACAVYVCKLQIQCAFRISSQKLFGDPRPNVPEVASACLSLLN